MQLLGDAGNTVAGAGDGPSGLEAVLSFGPHVAFVDVGLPGFDGYEVARRARAAGSRARLIALTGYSRREDKQRAVDAGFDEQLVKPLLNDDLQQSLARATPATNAPENGLRTAPPH